MKNYQQLKTRTSNLTSAYVIHIFHFVTGLHGMLIGDSAYQCTHYMLTPFPTETAKCIIEFNKGHRKA